jgi:hypothetical protein
MSIAMPQSFTVVDQGLSKASTPFQYPNADGTIS